VRSPGASSSVALISPMRVIARALRRPFGLCFEVSVPVPEPSELRLRPLLGFPITALPGRLAVTLGRSSAGEQRLELAANVGGRHQRNRQAMTIRTTNCKSAAARSTSSRT